METICTRALAFSIGVLPLTAQAAWSRLYPTQSPAARLDAMASCFEATGDILVLFGKPSNVNNSTFSDCWVFDGTNWNPFNGPLPPIRRDAGIAYDAARNRIVLFGGALGTTSTRVQDTWEWDGVAWSNPDPAVKPPERLRPAMTYDRMRHRTVLFAGNGAGNSLLDDLWEWDGTTWVDRTVATMPPGGPGKLMSYDPAHENVLLLATDYWSWDGVAWHRYTPAVPPLGERFTADLHRRRVTMPFGNGDQFAWEWDGSEWDIRLQASPSYRSGAAVVYDPLRRRTVVFGGYDGNARADTWVFRTPTPADVAPYGAGCAGTVGVPQLANAPYSLPWIGDTCRIQARGLPAAAAVFFVTGLSATPPTSLAQYGMPGCDQLVVPATVELRLASGSVAEWGLVVPNSLSLANVVLVQQAFSLDAGANLAGIVASNGITLATGIR